MTTFLTQGHSQARFFGGIFFEKGRVIFGVVGEGGGEGEKDEAGFGIDDADGDFCMAMLDGLEEVICNEVELGRGEEAREDGFPFVGGHGWFSRM